MTDRSEPEYVEHRVIEELAQRVGELEADVTVEGKVIRLSGRVASGENRRALVAAVAERFPDHEVQDDLEEVEVPPAPEGGERL